MFSLVIPVYRNAENLPRLFDELEQLASRVPEAFEVVFVVDASPDASIDILRTRLPTWTVRSQLLELSHNVGSFAAIAAGLAAGRGDYFAVMAADMQEPPDLILRFFQLLQSGRADVTFGHRVGRADPWASRVLSESFWRLYRRFVVKDMPRGGIDVFGCTRQVRDHLVVLQEVRTNLIALLLWLGFRREFVAYERRPRREGRSAWSFGKKIRYAVDSVFSFTDLPIRLLLFLGAAGTIAAMGASAVVLTFWLLGRVPVLGYTPLMLMITFFGGLTALGLGIVGQYLWISIQNTRGRPAYVVKSSEAFGDRT